MAVDPSVRVDLVAEFVGRKAFKEADTATQKLTKNVKKLGGAFGLAFGTAAVINFSKKAVKAFAQDEAAAIRLTRAVENLGIGFANPGISKFIAELERSAAIADDILRPAFQGLLTTTGSLTQSQKLLNDAITISRASGIDLATVSQDLANGYVGITKGLKKYNTGLTTAEISSKSFAEVLGVLLTRSAGSAEDYLGTTAFKMDSLTIATGNASEIIGGGLVNAFARIGGGTEASDAVKVIEDIAEAIAFTTEQVGALLAVIPNLFKTLANIPKNLVQGFGGAQVGKNLTPKPSVSKTPAQLSQEKQQKALAKLESDAAKRQKAILALTKKQTATAKKAADDQAKLSKAQSIFDLEKIQIEAALKGRISADEKLRLELQRAILNEDFELADKLQKKLEASQRATAGLQGQINSIKPAYDPFAEWIESLKEIGKTLSKILGMPVNTSSSMLNPNQPLVATQTPDSPFQPKPEPIPVVVIPEPMTTAAPSTNMPTPTGGGFGFSLPSYITSGANFAGGPYTPPAPVTIIVEGSILDGDDFSEIVNKATLNAYRRGLSQLPAGALP
jgi:hypothetical protein